MVCFYACLAAAIWLSVSPRAFQLQLASLGAQLALDLWDQTSAYGHRTCESVTEKGGKAGCTLLVAHRYVDARSAQFTGIAVCIFTYCIRKEGLRQEHTAILIVV